MEIIDRARQQIDISKREGTGNSKACYPVNIDGKEYVLLVYSCVGEESKMKAHDSVQAASELRRQGLSTPDVIGVDIEDDIVYELQERAAGKLFAYYKEGSVPDHIHLMDYFYETLKILDNANEKTFYNFMNDGLIFRRNGHTPDGNPGNFFIDNDGNITLIDLEVSSNKSCPDSDMVWTVCLGMLPWLLSTVVDSQDPRKVQRLNDYEHAEEVKERLKRIAEKWVKVAHEFLLENGLSEEKAKERMLSGIRGHYFGLEEDVTVEMINNCFGSREKTL